MNNISKLHYITQDNIFGYTHAQLAEEVCMGGADWVQLRVKKKGYSEWKEIAEDVQRICKKYKARLIINDNVRIAKEISADGVHLGKSDLDIAEARKILGNSFIIGGTANDFMDIEKLAAAKVDYIGLGPFRFTKTKENLSPVLGLTGFKSIMQACKDNNINIPMIAIGGILTEDIASILKTGVYGVAVSSGINMSDDKEEMYKRYNNAISGKVSKTKLSKS
jgi:thiamine-phosphate pyrophosphorylase